MRYLQSINISGGFFRYRYKDTELHHYQLTKDTEADIALQESVTQLAQQHFVSDKRFNLSGQKVYDIGVSFHRFNDKEVAHYINYSVGLGLYSDVGYKGNAQAISQSFPAPDNIKIWFIEQEKTELLDE